MTGIPKDGGAASAIDWAARARALAPLIEAASNRTEQEGRVPQDVMASMHEAQLFRMFLPRSIGGHESDPLTMMEVLEIVSATTGSSSSRARAGFSASPATSLWRPSRCPMRSSSAMTMPTACCCS